MAPERKRIPIDKNHRRDNRGDAREPDDERVDAENSGRSEEPAEPHEGQAREETATEGHVGEGPVREEAGASGTAAHDPSGQGAAAEDTVSESGRLAELEAEREGHLHDLRRLKAEFENYRKRTQRELSEARSQARGAMILEFLPVLDNLERALDASRHHEEAKLSEGVRMTHRAFVDLLGREGVEAIDPEGETFDPELHEAVFAQSSDKPEGTVIYVIEKGYVLGDRVLRPAKVAVSSGSEGQEG